jgi:cyclopropane fatty-acyl-phospholipid synthase-like methyltransferase
MLKNFIIFLTAVLSSCISSKGNISMNASSQYWDQKWQTTVKEFKPNSFAMEAMRRTFSNGDVKELALLDLGCGDGKDSFFFAEHGAKVLAIDVSHRALQAIKARNLSIMVEQQNLEQLALPHDAFDIIYAHLSLHYFTTEKTIDIIEKLRLALKNRGSLFIKVKSTNDWQFGQGKKLADDIFEDGHLRHFFTVKKMESLLQGFSKREVFETKDYYENHPHAFIEAIATK